MALMVQAIRGMNDLLPEDTSVWQQVEKFYVKLYLHMAIVKFVCQLLKRPNFSAEQLVR